MICQVEISTFCNAKCFYCPNEFLDHQHMPFELFTELLETFPANARILLQGTGELLLHPQFWQMTLSVFISLTESSLCAAL